MMLMKCLPTTRGYSLCVPNWSRFRGDYATEEVKLHGEHERLVQTLKRYFKANGLDTDWSALQRLPTVKLMNTLSMALPFSEQDKQVLLETIEPAERLFTFTALLDSEHHESGSSPLIEHLLAARLKIDTAVPQSRLQGNPRTDHCRHSSNNAQTMGLMILDPNNQGGHQIGVLPEKGQEYKAVRISGRTMSRDPSKSQRDGSPDG